MQTIDTILIDLDGTLLGMDLKNFEKLYFGALSEALADLIAPQELIQHVWASTVAMVQNLDFRTNEEIFMEDLARRVEGDIQVYRRHFHEFYEEGFGKTKASVIENTYMQQAVKMLQEKGYQVVIATNPIFPLKAIHHRIRWAGFEPSEFSYISHFEMNHYCKPQLQYYEEVLRDIGKDPSQCLMVGNDVQEDLVAGKLGMKTYLITDHLIHRTEEEIAADHIGGYEDFYRFVDGLPAVEK